MKDLNAGQKKPLVHRMITHAKKIIAEASSWPKLPVTGALQPAHVSDESMNLAEFIVFMEYRTDPRSSLIPKASDGGAAGAAGAAAAAAAAAAADDDDDDDAALHVEAVATCSSGDVWWPRGGQGDASRVSRQYLCERQHHTD